MSALMLYAHVYGRPRVGKSELILRFLRGKRAVYHVGKTAPGSLQLKEFLVDVARVLEEPLLARLPTNVGGQPCLRLGRERKCLETQPDRKAHRQSGQRFVERQAH
jgi:hypothetical protein